MLGRLLYAVRSKYRHGLRTAYYRDRVRTRIVNTPPVTNTVSKRCEIHTLTSANDWLNLLWALKSFYYHSGADYSLCIHDDGTLTRTAAAALCRHFPNARFIDRGTADRAILPVLSPYQRSRELRTNNTLAIKLFDFAHFLEADRMLLIDSDILFFSRPAELIRRAEDSNYGLNTANRDVDSAYTVEPAAVAERFGFSLIPRFNSGLAVLQRASLRMDWIEDFLHLPDVIGYFWRIEQTLFALCSSRFGVELLPPDYDVRLKGSLNGHPCRHYVGAIRHLMYAEGVRNLVRKGFLKDLDSSACRN